MNLICVDNLCHHISPEKIIVKNKIFEIDGERYSFTNQHKIYNNVDIPLDWEPFKYFYYGKIGGWRLNPTWTSLQLQTLKKIEIKLFTLCKVLYDANIINDDQMKTIVSCCDEQI